MTVAKQLILMAMLVVGGAPGAALAQYPYHACFSCDSCGNCYSGCEAAGCRGTRLMSAGNTAVISVEDSKAVEVLQQCEDLRQSLKASNRKGESIDYQRMQTYVRSCL